jgi:hypothetical protein
MRYNPNTRHQHGPEPGQVRRLAPTRLRPAPPSLAGRSPVPSRLYRSAVAATGEALEAVAPSAALKVSFVRKTVQFWTGFGLVLCSFRLRPSRWPLVLICLCVSLFVFFASFVVAPVRFLKNGPILDWFWTGLSGLPSAFSLFCARHQNRCNKVQIRAKKGKAGAFPHSSSTFDVRWTPNFTGQL